MAVFQRLLTRLLATHYPWPAVDITLPGKRHLHLVGSIHMGVPGMSPLPAPLLDKLRRADALIVEADMTGNNVLLGTPPDQTPLTDRLTQNHWTQTVELAQELGIPLSALEHQPAWQAALTLQAHQAHQLGLRPEFGIDLQLITAAHELSLPVIELEGAQHQLNLLKQLPESGLDLLTDTLTHWHTNARLLQMMVGWWLHSPPEKPEKMSLPNTFGDLLFEVLMHQRNQQWSIFLQQLPAGRYIVAMGALHLYGEGNLPEILQSQSAH